jgi:hypothetical protein
LHKVEEYSKLFYRAKHKNAIDQVVGPRWDDEDEKKFSAHRWKILRDIVSEGFDNATDKELAEVEEFLEKEKQD